MSFPSLARQPFLSVAASVMLLSATTQCLQVAFNLVQVKAQVFPDLDVGQPLDPAPSRALVHPGNRDFQELGHFVNGEKRLGRGRHSRRGLCDERFILGYNVC